MHDTFISRRGIAPILLVLIAVLVLGGGGALYLSSRTPREAATPQPLGNQTAREIEPAVPSDELCRARCRDEYGGSGSPGFDACIRACGAARETAGDAAGTLREQACPSPGPACPSPQIPECKNGRWACIGPASGGGGASQPGNSAGGSAGTSAYVGEKLAGTSAPLLDFAKKDYDAAIASGKLVLLYFYANWCPICKAEFPKMQAAFDGLTTDKVVGFRANFKDSDTDADEVALARQFGVAYQHTKVFVRNGALVSKHPDSWDTARYTKEIMERP